MWRESLVCILILLLVLVVMAVFGGCSEEQVGGPVALDKAYTGNHPGDEGLVDTYILNGELDEEFPEDQQIYPYYEVHHGPEAGRYAFSEGDTVPDGAYVVFKARASTEEAAINQLGVQGHFTAGAHIRTDGIWFSFASTYSHYDLLPPWRDKERSLAADTLGFEVGPFRYDVAMRGVIDLGDPVSYRDPSPDTLTFYGNYPPCVQCVELVNIDTEPVYQYDQPCWSQTCFDEVPQLQVYHTLDARYLEDSPDVLRVQYGTDNMVWVRAAAGQITFTEPADPTQWTAIPAIHYAYLVYLHGKDHPQEHWPEGQPLRGVDERIKAWRYQVDYAMDLDNAIIDGGGVDDIDFLSGFPVQDNNPDPLLSDMYIEVDPTLGGARGAWALRVTVGVPALLMTQGRDVHWAFLRVLYAASPAPPPDAPVEEILAWQAEPATQEAYQAWKLTTMQFSPGTVSVIAADQSTCDWRLQTNMYHYYLRTRPPTPHGRRCDDDAYNQPPEFIEMGSVDLADFIVYSDDREPTVKDFDLQLYLPGEDDPFEAGEDPPGWIAAPLVDASPRASRY